MGSGTETGQENTMACFRLCQRSCKESITIIFTKDPKINYTAIKQYPSEPFLDFIERL